MNDSIAQRGAVRSTRILIGVVAACVTCLVLATGSASAKTIYKYVYSGEFFDGSGSTKGQFKSLGGLDYDPATQNLYVNVFSSPSVIGKFTKAGAPAKFSALNNGAGRDYIDLARQASGEISVDTSSNAATKGNIYLQAGGTFLGYHPNGLLIEPAFGTAAAPGTDLNQGCGGASGPNGEFYDFTFGNGQPEIHRRNLDTFKAEVTYLTEGTFGRPMMCNMKLDSQANFYGLTSEGFFGQAAVKLPPEPIVDFAGGTAERPPEREQRYRLNAACCGLSVEENIGAHIGIDRSSDDVFLVETLFVPEFGTSRVSLYDAKGGLVTQFGGAEGAYQGLRNVGGITVDPVTHDVYVTNNRDYGAEVRHVEKFVRGPSFTVPTTDTEQPSQPSTFSAGVLRGTLNPDGLATESCYFEYGLTQSLGSKVPCTQGQVLTGSSDIAVSAPVAGLEKGTKYWVKLFAANSANEIVSDGGPEKFLAQSRPIPSQEFVSKVNTDGANFNATIDPNGGRTWYYWEYGPSAAYGQKTPETRLRREDNTEYELPASLTEPFVVSNLVSGFEPGKPIHFRIVVRNEQGTLEGPDQEFVTYVQESEPSCPNSLVRQQTGSALLLDCRAYELASTSYSGGHDVVSSTIAGQKPLVSYPDASGRLLYSLDSGVVPGVAGDPTNLGRDPYVAVRGAGGWTTEYVGLPSGGMADPGSFGSPLLEADSGLGQFAFGGQDICDPCFADGSTNIPLRRSSGSIEKGMAGSLNPAADPAGEVRRRFSADGSTFVFSADKKFESTGNEGSVSIYRRDLRSGSTQVVSRLPNGSTMTGAGIAELDVSSNGDRVLIGKRVSEDGDGNEYFDLYMNVGGDPSSVLVVDSPSGVIFNGMTADGSKVFFTTPDPLAGDGDLLSNDFFVADVGATSTITRLSTGTGGTGNTDSCAPVANWNVVTGGPNCGTASIAGGGGVAGEDGTAYFFSPELLDGAGNGEPNQPNLYVVEPGDSPKFVATIDSGPVGNPAVVHGVHDSATHSYEDFQVSPDGRYALFSSVLSLTGYANRGNSELYRYDTASGSLDCASCAPTLQPAQNDVGMTPYGLSMTDDGRVFFTTKDSFVLRDTNGKTDAYEWASGRTQLISSGLGPTDSALLSVSADGKDAFFFTRDLLSRQDGNGSAVKIYDAREGGGFLFEDSPQPCAASDECHGAGTEQPGAPNINTATGEGPVRQVKGTNCGQLTNKAKKERQRADQLRRKAKSASASRSKKLHKQAKKAAKKAQRLEKEAKACTQTNGGGAK